MEDATPKKPYKDMNDSDRREYHKLRKRKQRAKEKAAKEAAELAVADVGIKWAVARQQLEQTNPEEYATMLAIHEDIEYCLYFVDQFWLAYVNHPELPTAEERLRASVIWWQDGLELIDILINQHGTVSHPWVDDNYVEVDWALEGREEVVCAQERGYTRTVSDPTFSQFGFFSKVPDGLLYHFLGKLSFYIDDHGDPDGAIRKLIDQHNTKKLEFHPCIQDMPYVRTINWGAPYKKKQPTTPTPSTKPEADLRRNIELVKQQDDSNIQASFSTKVGNNG